MELDLAPAIPRFRTHLCLGRSGAGKTRLLGTFPKPIYMFCFDDGWDTLAMQEGITANILDPSVTKEDIEIELIKALQDLSRKKYKYPDGREEEYKTIAFDPYSFYSQWLFDANPPDSIQEWGLFGPKLLKPLKMAKASGKYVYVSCHTQLRELQVKKTIKKGDQTSISSGEFAWLPMIHTQARENFSAWFDTTFEITRSGAGDATLSFIPANKRENKARLCFEMTGLFGSVEPADFRVLKEKFDKKIAEIQSKKEKK